MTRLTLAMTAWLALGIPLWFYTILVGRAELDLALLEQYDELSTKPIPAAVRIGVYGEHVPDLAAACEHYLNSKQTQTRFIVDSECSNDTELCVHAKFGTSDALGLDSGSTRLEVEYSQQTMVDGRIPEVVGILVLQNVYRSFLDDKNEPLPAVTAGYAPNLHLTFSLFSEHGQVVEWQAAEAIEYYLGDLLAQINNKMVNLTVDTQTGLYADMLVNTPETNSSRHLDRTQLANFVDFAEWPLTSLTAEPTLNFVLYVPSSELIVDSSASNSFIIPQWGGVKILQPLQSGSQLNVDDLGPAMAVFSKQLLVLLGMRESQNGHPASRPAFEIRLNELARRNSVRGLRAAAASIGSLQRLVASMPAIPIPSEVVSHVHAAQRAIDGGLRALEQADVQLASKYAAEAFSNAERAFFNKDMVAQAYFPDEHKLAVYMPLIGPLCIVVFSGWARIVKGLKAKKNELNEAKKHG